MTSHDVDLSSLSPGPRTDLEILALQDSVLEQREGFVVVRSPLQPTFHWGNVLRVTTGDVEDADRWLAAFREEFPQAGWVAIGLPRMPEGSAWQEQGLAPEPDDVLSLRGLPAARPLPEGYVAREFRDQSDWDQLHETSLRERAAEVGGDLASYATFSRERERSWRRLASEGHLAWFGAFTTAGELAASLGIVVLGADRSLARYQSVLTAPDHRRRGLAGHLLGVAADWAAERGARELVIVTDLDNPAGRLYRGVGFTPTTSDVSVYRAPQE